MSFNGSGTFQINTAGQPVVSGTVISSTAFNALTADLATGLSTCITKDGQTTVTANLPMSTFKFTGLGAGSAATDSANLSQVQSTVVKLLGSVSGADTITAVGSPVVTAYAAGQMFYFVAAGANTTTVTLNIDGLGAKAVTRDGATALAAGDIQSGEVCVVVYDGTRFQLINAANSFGNTTINGTLTVTGNTNLQANVSITSALNVGGVATFTSNPVLSGGTANGVLYLNASKVATSGSALTFDGTNFNAGSATFPSGRVRLKQADDTTKQKGLIIEAAADDSILAVGYDGTCFTYNATYNTGGAYKPQAWWVSGSESMRLNSTGLGIGTSSPGAKLDVDRGASNGFTARIGRTSGTQFYFYSDASASYLSTDLNLYNAIGFTPASNYINFYTNNAERMRLDSSGNLGIGTSSPGYKLDVSGQAKTTNGFIVNNGTNAGFFTTDGTNVNFGSSTSGKGLALFVGASSQAALFDSSGNLGLGVTPSAWGSGWKAVQVGLSGALSFTGAGSNDLSLSTNSHNDGSNWIYKYTGDASARYSMTATGVHRWFTAGTGTAGGTISYTQAMTLTELGRLNVTATSGNGGQINLFGNAGTTGEVTLGQGFSLATDKIAYLYNRSNEAFVFGTNNTERARITSGGYFKASNAGTYNDSAGSYHEFRSNTSGQLIAYIQHTTATSPFGIEIDYTAADPNGTGNSFFACYGQANLRAGIRSNGGLANYQSNNADLSDARTKKDITPAASMWGKIGALEIVTYKYNDQTHDDVNLGVIAQQVEAVEPVWVDNDGFGETPEGEEPLKTVYTKDITFAAIKALQEAMARIEQLEAKVAALESK